MNLRSSATSCPLGVRCSVVELLWRTKHPETQRQHEGAQRRIPHRESAGYRRVFICFPSIARAGSWANGSVTNSAGSRDLKSGFRPATRARPHCL